MIELYYNLLTAEEKVFLKNKCDNFVETHSPSKPGYNNTSYHKYQLDETTDLLNLQNRLLNFIKEKGNSDIKKILFWIVRADVNTNQNDDFHVDNSDFTIVTYLNDDFTGGDFVYLVENKEDIYINVEKDLSILMDNETPHKITPVTSGVRFSFVCFFNHIPKTKKSLI
jgi:hypothetical protein